MHQELIKPFSLAPLRRVGSLAVVTAMLWSGLATAAPFAYISNNGAGSVSVIDLASNTVVATVAAVGTNPYGVATNGAGTRVYVTNQVSNTLAVLDAATSTVVTTVAVGLSPVGVVVQPGRGCMWRT